MDTTKENTDLWTALTIATELKVSKAAVFHALGRNMLPSPERVGTTFVWRQEQFEEIRRYFEKKKKP